MRSNPGELSFACTGDWHFFDSTLRTTSVIQSLVNAFPDTDETGKLDYVLIDGDVFDRSESLYKGDVGIVHGWITNFLSMCNRRNIRVRVLEGTPSHDRGQSRLFKDINKSLGDKAANLKYIKTLTIDYEEEFDFHVLYVPDEWHRDLDVVWDQVKEQLKLHNLEKVEVAVMHGTMHYQLPNNIPIPSHNTNKYADIVKWFGTVGHIHTSGRFRNFFSPGSLDRKYHNEEGPKGHYRIIVDLSDGSIKSKFIVNHIAMPFLTLDVTSMVYDEAYVFAVETVNKVLEIKEISDRPVVAAIRLKLTPELSRLSIIRNLTDNYPMIKWGIKKVSSELDLLEEDDSMEFKLAAIESITSSNIASLTMERICNMDLDPLVQEETKNILQEVLDG